MAYLLIGAGCLGIVLVAAGALNWAALESQARQAGTPTPTGRPSAQDRVAIGAYLDTVPRLVLKGMNGQVQAIHQLEQLQGRPTFALTPEWRGPMSTAVATMRRANQDIRTYLPVPPQADELHRRMMEIGDDLGYNAEQFADFMDGHGPEHIERAAERAELLNARIASTLPAIEALARWR